MRRCGSTSGGSRPSRTAPTSSATAPGSRSSRTRSRRRSSRPSSTSCTARASAGRAGLIDVGVEQGFIRKAGAWYTYEGDQLGQGKENARTFLKDNPDLANEIEKRILEKLGIGAVVTADLTANDEVLPAPVDF